jgi:hypothetical protein
MPVKGKRTVLRQVGRGIANSDRRPMPDPDVVRNLGPRATASRYHDITTKQTTVRLPDDLAERAEAVARVRGRASMPSSSTRSWPRSSGSERTKVSPTAPDAFSSGTRSY